MYPCTSALNSKRSNSKHSTESADLYNETNDKSKLVIEELEPRILFSAGIESLSHLGGPSVLIQATVPEVELSEKEFSVRSGIVSLSNSPLLENPKKSDAVSFNQSGVLENSDSPSQPIKQRALSPSLSVGLVAHYALDETSGTTAIDSSSNSNNGTLIGGSTRVDGYIGIGAIDFAADFDRVEVADNTALDFGSGDFSTSFWFNSGFPPAANARLIGQADGANGWVIFSDNAGDLNFLVLGSTTSTTVSVNGLLDNTWHHLTAQRSGNSFEVYIDGSLVSSTTANVGTVTSTEPLMLGTSTAISSEYDGLLDEVRIYNRALSTAEIGELAAPPLVVDTTSDVADGDTSSIKALRTDKGADGRISLREAILATNNSANGAAPDEIHFDISGVGPHTIAVTSALPDITDTVVIDGTTDPDFLSTPIIELSGASAGASVNGLSLADGSDGSTIRGLVINRFNGVGVDIQSGADGNTIAGNYVGTDVTGTLDFGNDTIGILVFSANNVIGGTTAADRNVASGNQLDGIRIEGVAATNNTIIGNYVGLNATGTASLGNAQYGIRLNVGASGTVVGGDTAAERNVIASDGFAAIDFSGDAAANVRVQGNYIGTDATGTSELGNATYGLLLRNGARNNLIGGIAPGEGNLISGHSTAIGMFDGVSSTFNNAVLGNSILSSSALGIDLDIDGVSFNDSDDADSGANDALNFPVLQSVAQNGANLDVDFAIDLVAGDYRIEFFDNASGLAPSGFGEGETFIGFMNITATGAGGYESFSTTLTGVTASDIANITTTATEDLGGGNFGSTSEFGPQFQGVGTLIVDTTTDTLDGDTSSIVSLLGNRGADGLISLREAITATNNTSNGSGPDEIHFNIAGAGPHSLTLGSALPTIIDAVVLDGWTEPDYGSTPIIELNGSALGAGVNGLAFSGGGSGSTVRGFVINQFSNSGIFLSNASNISIEGNYIGTDTSGAVDMGNGTSGIVLSNADNNTIGGLTTAERNVISGNTSHGIDLQNGAASNSIHGNYIGTNAAGTATLGNGNWGIAVSSGSNANTIGGTSAAARNVISGNTVGIDFTGVNTRNNTVSGNYIGLNAAGANNLGNSNAAIVVQGSAHQNTIGGTTTAHRNVIAGGSTDGIRITGANDTSILNNYIGVNAAGDTDRGFTQEGIEVSNASNTIIGALNQGNVISGNNAAGIGVQAGASGTKIIANLIGTNASNSGGIANSQHGISISGDASNTTIGTELAGEGNTIQFNLGDGVNIAGTGTGHHVVGNSIVSNSELGIDLGMDGPNTNDNLDGDLGANNLQNYPNLSEAITNDLNSVTITGALNSEASTDYLIHFYANSAADSSGFGEGQRYLGSTNVSTDLLGNASFSSSLSVLVNDGEVVSATATEDLGGGNLGSTSEFSAIQLATLPVPLIDLDDDNSSGAADPGFTANFTEGGGAVAAADGDATLSDGDSATLDSLTVTLTNVLNGAAEILSANTSGTSITANYTSATGVLLLSGTDTVANYRTVLRTVTYNNVSAIPDTTTRIINFVANDGGSDGNTAQSVVSITAVNNQPGFTNLDATASFTENGATVVLDNNAGVSDVELGALNGGNGNYDGTSLTLLRNGGVNSDDVFSFASGNGITLSGGNLIKNSQIIGTFDTTTTQGELLISFTDANSEIPTSADVNNVIRQINYSNSSDAPPGTVQVSWTFSDGNSGSQGSGGLGQANGSSDVNISAVNDAPVLDNAGVPTMTSITEDDTGNSGDLVSDIIATGAGGDPISDADSGALEGIAIRGFITPGAGTWQFSTDSGSNWFDVGTVSDASALLLGSTDRLRYVPNPATGADSSTLSWKAWDQTTGTAGNKVSVAASGGTTAFSSANEALDISVTAVNDAPIATNLNAAESYTEDTPLNLVDIVVSDVDHTTTTVTLTLSDSAAGALSTGTSGAVTSTYNAGTGVWSANGDINDVNVLLAGVTFTPTLNYDQNFSIATSVSDGVAPVVTGTKNVTATPVNDAPTATNLNAPEAYTEDTPLNLVDIVVTNVDNANTTVTLTLSDIAAGSLSTATSGAVTSTYNAGTGVWQASGAVADVNVLLADVTFNPTLNYNGNFSIATFMSDGIAPAITGVKSVTGIAVNDAPTATNLTTDESYSEDVPHELLDIVVTDVDNANVIVTLTLSDPMSGTFNTGSSGAVISSYDAVNGIWQAAGLTADVNALLASLVFTPSADISPDVTVSTAISDGTAADVTGVKTLFGTAVNDAPTATNLNAPETFVEDMPLDIADIIVADIDSTTVTVTLTLSNTAAGQLSTSTAGASTSSFDALSGVWTASGLIADVNSLLVDVSFIPNPNFSEDFDLITSVDDGVAPPVLGSKTMTNVAVNDPPSASNMDIAESYTEDTPLILTPIMVNDVDSPNVTVTLSLSDPGAGVLSTASVGTVTSTYDADSGQWRASGAIDDVNAVLATVEFTPSLNYNSDLTIVTEVSDGIASLNGSKAMTGIPVNDAPVAQGEQFDLVEDGSLLIDVESLLSNDSDVDGDELSIELVGNPRFGQLLTNDDGTLLYQPTAGFVGRDFFTYRVSDGELTSELQIVDLLVQDNGASGTVITEPEDEIEEPTEEIGDTVNSVPRVQVEDPAAPTEFSEPDQPLDTRLPTFDIQTITSDTASAEFFFEAEPNSGDDAPVNRALVRLNGQELDLTAIELLFADDGIWRDITQTDQGFEPDRIMVQTLAGGGVAFSTGVIAWILRGGSLLASILTTLPAWRSFDPIPIMAKKHSKEKKNEGIDELFD